MLRAPLFWWITKLSRLLFSSWNQFPFECQTCRADCGIPNISTLLRRISGVCVLCPLSDCKFHKVKIHPWLSGTFLCSAHLLAWEEHFMNLVHIR
jgi:hypothetical protein